MLKKEKTEKENKLKKLGKWKNSQLLSSTPKYVSMCHILVRMMCLRFLHTYKSTFE